MSDSQLSSDQLKRKEVEIPKASFGRVCGKGMASVGDGWSVDV